MAGPGLEASVVRCPTFPEPLFLRPLCCSLQIRILQSRVSLLSGIGQQPKPRGDYSLLLVREECAYVLASLCWWRPDGISNPVLPWASFT